MNQFLLHEVKFCPMTRNNEVSISRLAAASCLCCPCLTTATGAVSATTARSPWTIWTSVASSTTAAMTPWWPADSARWGRRVMIMFILVRCIFQVPHPLLSSYSWSRDSEDALVCDDCAEWVASHTFTCYLLANWEWYTEDDITV